MKKVFFILILLSVLFSSIYNCKISCPDWEDNYVSKEEILAAKEKSESHPENNNNSIFLGLSFGMSLPETYNTLWQLKNQKIITHIDTGYGLLGASYTMNYRGYSNTGKIYCFYNQYRLRELQIDTLQQISGNLLELFVNKYGECDYFADNELNKEYHWIRGNQHVTVYSFHNSDRLLIQFVNTAEKINNSEINLLQDWGLTGKA